MQSAINISHLNKSFGDHLVLDDININVPQGSVYGFLGNNGAGKSTLIRILLGLLKLDSGSVQIGSNLITTKDIHYKKNIGCLVDSPCIYLHLTPKEYLGISCKIKNLDYNAIERALDIVSMKKHKNLRMDKFSLGMKQRIAIANALLGDPKLLILDEPTNGLDPEGMLEIRNLLKSLPEKIGATVFLSSHLLDEIQKTATHVGILHQGKMMLESPLNELIETQSSSLDILTDDAAQLKQYFQTKALKTMILTKQKLRVNLVKLNQCAKINREVINAGFNLIESRFNQASLESLFLNMVQNYNMEDKSCSLS